jgi:hypothetical protein
MSLFSTAILAALAVAQSAPFVTPTRAPGEVTWDAALNRVLTDPAAGCINTAEPRLGCRIVFSCGTFDFDDTIHISRSHIIEGSGRCTIIRHPRFRTRFVLHNATTVPGGFRSTSPIDPTGGPASYGEIRDLQSTVRSSVLTATVGHGIVVRAAYTSLVNVEINGAAGHGIFYDCDVNRGSNCNLAKLDRVRVIRSFWSGIYGRGGDFNASLFSLLDTSANCEQPAFLPTNPAICANMVDLGFLGNTYLAPHMDSSGSARGFFQRNGASSTLVLGGYTENTDRVNEVWDTTGMVLGGNFNMSAGNAYRHRGRVISSGLSIRNETDPNNRVQLDLGTAVPASGHAFSIAYYGTAMSNSPRRLVFRSTLLNSVPAVEVGVDFLNSARAQVYHLLPSPLNPLITRGRVWSPQGILINNPPLVGTSTLSPTRR